MVAPIGNKFWEARTTHGRDLIFSTPEVLWNACIEYFQWVDDNPLLEAQAFAYQGEITQAALPKMRAMTKEGLCLFLGIGTSTLEDYKSRQDFSVVIMRIEMVLRDQKFSGAAAGLLNPNIIARDLGLRDKTDHEHSGTIGISDLTEDELDRRIAQLAEQTAKG